MTAEALRSVVGAAVGLRGVSLAEAIILADIEVVTCPQLPVTLSTWSPRPNTQLCVDMWEGRFPQVCLLP